MKDELDPPLIGDYYKNEPFNDDPGVEGQESLFDQRRDGATYNPDRDYARLNAQHLRVYEAMKHGEWRTLFAMSMETGDPEASVSARLRDFRKPRFGGHTVERNYIGDGLWRYRLIWNPEVPRP